MIRQLRLPSWLLDHSIAIHGQRGTTAARLSAVNQRLVLQINSFVWRQLCIFNRNPLSVAYNKTFGWEASVEAFIKLRRKKPTASAISTH